MTNDSREQILADFIECTGLEDMNECITFLEQYQWNLLNAVQAVHERFGGSSSVASGNDSTVPKSSSTVKKPSHTTKVRRSMDSDDEDNSDGLKIIKSVPGNARISKGAVGGVTRGGMSRELCFSVEYKDHTERITISDNETIHDLQLKIADKLGVPTNHQRFSNWHSKQFNNHTVLKELNLPKDNEIHLISTASSTVNGASRSSTSTTTTNRTHRHQTSPTKQTTSSYYPLTVLCEDKNGKMTPYELVLKPNATINDLKKEIEQVAHIPIRQQSWQGLLDAKDSDELNRTKIQRKTHLQVKRIDSSTNQRTTKNSTVHQQHIDDEPMEVDNFDFEQYDDGTHSVYPIASNATTVTSSSSNRELLIPDRCTNDMVALENFSRVFHYRFGSTGPILYIGPLEEAIQASISAPRLERRPLAIYVHNDRSVCANVFCTQVLAIETTIEYLANNYVVWAWDVSTDANRARFFELVKRHLGHHNAQQISVMEKDTYPLLLVVNRARGSIELTSVIEGKSTPSEVLLNLIQAHDAFEKQQQRDAAEEIQREKREDLKKQQEDEYHRSLQTDLAKEQARLNEERKQKEEENLIERKKQKQLKEQQECLARLSEEPKETDKNITRFKIRLPDDEGILMRRFRISDQLQTLFDYLTSQGKVLNEYKLLTTYPKRDLTTLNRSDTFEQLKLFPQEQLILENL